MTDPVQIRLSGSGGQGLITAGIILAEAAMLDGRNVVQTQTYGPEARLGSSKSEVIISSGRIAYPEATIPDVLVCLSQDAARAYLADVHPDTTVILDATNIGPDLTGVARVFRMPITEAAVRAGGKLAANTAALRAMNAICHVVSAESLAAAIGARVPARFRDLNEAAGRAGDALARDALAAGPCVA